MSGIRSMGFRIRAEAHWQALRPIPAAIIAHIARELDAGASVDARLLLADQLRAVAEHLRHLGAEAEAAAFRLLAEFIPLMEFSHDP